MTKNELAKQINAVHDIISRTISVDHKLDLQVGQVYDNRGKAESWSGDECTEGFHCELDHLLEYVFICRNVPVHEVDYENEAECDLLDCRDCHSEGEVLVPATTKMIIKDISTDEDYEEMGYYEVALELVK